MAHRFKIEDIEVQDSTGVVFRATDMETQRTVAVRRFFPFGPNGGGLNEEEQREYASALEHLEEIHHPTLRSIISGGCDAVDGMPFIATEWVEGVALRSILLQRPLSQAEAVVLLIHALEACEALSAVLGREGVWIETDPHVIIIGAEEAQRRVTFWISPLRWLGQTSGQKGFEPLVVLTESVMGWESGSTSHGFTGVGKWLEWLRGAERTASLREVREKLAAFQRVEISATATRRVPQPARASQSSKKPVKSKSAALVWILASCILTVIGLGGWILIRTNEAKVAALSGPLEMESISTPSVVQQKPTMATVAEPVTEGIAVIESLPVEREFGEKTPAQAARMFQQGMAQRQQEEAALQARRAEVRKRGGFYLSDDSDLLLEMKGSEVTIEGRLNNPRFATGKNPQTYYLEFSEHPGKQEPRGFVRRENLTSSMNENHFKNLQGKKIRICGKVVISRKRPEIEITDPSQVTEVP